MWISRLCAWGAAPRPAGHDRGEPRPDVIARESGPSRGRMRRSAPPLRPVSRAWGIPRIRAMVSRPVCDARISRRSSMTATNSPSLRCARSTPTATGPPPPGPDLRRTVTRRRSRTPRDPTICRGWKDDACRRIGPLGYRGSPSSRTAPKASGRWRNTAIRRWSLAITGPSRQQADDAWLGFGVPAAEPSPRSHGR